MTKPPRFSAIAERGQMTTHPPTQHAYKQRTVNEAFDDYAALLMAERLKVRKLRAALVDLAHQRITPKAALAVWYDTEPKKEAQ